MSFLHNNNCCRAGVNYRVEDQIEPDPTESEIRLRWEIEEIEFLL